MRELLRGGADPIQAKNDGNAPVFVASAWGHREVIRDLLKAGADTNVMLSFGLTIGDGGTPLYFAHLRGDTRLV